ncbi:MAG: hypothetical protein GPOALKHO_000257 [Sodalis sp.]|uniref:hypothetical protein n=1 Tax=Sodalis sp. (in: enterobacteria) TaxID=1898979 RepID=UPI003872DE37|nr:MAG: hypothetical protein GPOALKHO_000257 [Sodalis sp.]
MSQSGRKCLQAPKATFAAGLAIISPLQPHAFAPSRRIFTVCHPTSYRYAATVSDVTAAGPDQLLTTVQRTAPERLITRILALSTSKPAKYCKAGLDIPDRSHSAGGGTLGHQSAHYKIGGIDRRNADRAGKVCIA